MCHADQYIFMGCAMHHVFRWQSDNNNLGMLLGYRNNYFHCALHTYLVAYKNIKKTSDRYQEMKLSATALL